MVRHVMLIKFTDKGIANVQDSPARAEAFRSAAAKAGVTVETQLWTLGEYDGLVVFSATDEQAAVSLSLSLGKLGFVRTCTLRAFQAEEFKTILSKTP